jgi:hypothetical protein
MYTVCRRVVNSQWNIDMVKVPLGARVEPEVKAAIEKAAKQEKRSLTAQVEVILLEWLDARKKRPSK